MLDRRPGSNDLELDFRWVCAVSCARIRCIAHPSRWKYDQPTLYCRSPRCTSAQHTTCEERDHSRPFCNRLKGFSSSSWPVRAGPTNPRTITRGVNQKVIFLRSSPIWHMRSSTYLSHFLINDICLFKLFYFKSIDIKVPREPIVAQSRLSVNAWYLCKHWNYPNFLNASYHYRNIVPHIHVYFCNKL